MAVRYPRPVFLALQGRPSRPTEVPRRAVFCLGNFDGVHRAHDALIRAAAERAHAAGCPAAVFCFFRPSSDYLPPREDHEGNAPRHLCSLREKLSLFAAAGADLACLVDFSALRDMPPSDFITFLRESCHAQGIACGFNYRYGAGGAGDAASLAAAFSAPEDVPPLILGEQAVDGLTISSTRIRTALSDGDPRTAAALLGRPYALESRVLHGKQLGRRLGFPTANQTFPPDRLIPAHGVYATRVHTPEGIFTGVSNIGLRPTVENTPTANCETNILDYDGDLYGQLIRVELWDYLRPEQRFPNTALLRDAVLRDAERARELLSRRM